MAPVRTTRAKKKFADFDEKPVKDFDPEADGPPEDGASGSDEEDEGEDVAGTEHYVSVGKSKLRQKEPPALGPKYSGVRVSRAALDDSSDDELKGQEESDEESSEEEGDSEEYDDPETADLERDNIIDDEEIDSDEAFGEGEEEMFKKKGFSFKDSKSTVSGPSKVVTNGRPKRMVAADLMSDPESEEEDDDDGEECEVDVGSDDGDEGAQLDGTGSEEEASDDEEEGSFAEEESEEGSDESEDEDEDEDEEMVGADASDDRSNLRSLMQSDQKGVVSNISQAAKADAEKGVAVRQQRRTYDSLLNLRIRLQKGLVAINSLGEAGEIDSTSDQQPYVAAEEAAIKLWAAIDGFRASLLPEPKAGQKRKRDVDTDTSIEEIWEDMQATEERATAKRNKILDKWSNKVKSTTAAVNKERHLGTTATQSLVDALGTQLLSSERLVRRTQVPRSCAPLQAAKKVTEDPDIYDDADFYQLLLKELVNQRTNDAGGGEADGNVPTVRWTAVKEAKTRKQVDRRASKGRKLRFTVHEKLQNFMASEDRRTWEDEAIDRLFGTLFGQRMQLREDASEDEEDDDMAAAEEGLRLFRN